MKLRRLSAQRRRVIAWVAGCFALGAIGVRAFVIAEGSPWYLILWGLQGVAMVVTWMCWRSQRERPADRGVDLDAKRLHW
ncbi:hypothetical protein ACIBEF_25210 [Micromonospora sp. NPDC050795]|uniref:hypothetical protein n=1 Tax=Micromonospora sp. NPDC050795 TaxID=3364282 RepID=UPI00379C3851